MLRIVLKPAHLTSPALLGSYDEKMFESIEYLLCTYPILCKYYQYKTYWIRGGGERPTQDLTSMYEWTLSLRQKDPDSPMRYRTIVKTKPRYSYVISNGADERVSGADRRGRRWCPSKRGRATRRLPGPKSMWPAVRWCHACKLAITAPNCRGGTVSRNAPGRRGPRGIFSLLKPWRHAWCTSASSRPPAANDMVRPRAMRGGCNSHPQQEPLDRLALAHCRSL